MSKHPHQVKTVELDMNRLSEIVLSDLKGKDQLPNSPDYVGFEVCFIAEKHTQKFRVTVEGKTKEEVMQDQETWAKELLGSIFSEMSNERRWTRAYGNPFTI